MFRRALVASLALAIVPSIAFAQDDPAKEAESLLVDHGGILVDDDITEYVSSVTGLEIPLVDDDDFETAALEAWALFGPAFGRTADDIVVIEQTIDGAERVVVQLAQYRRGLPVVDAGASLGFDRDGNLRTIGSSWVPVSVELPAPEALITAEAAFDEAQKLAGHPVFIPESGLPAGLVWFTLVDAPRLAWEIYPMGRHALESYVYWVSAEDGEVLAARELARHDGLANAYIYNPGPDADAATEEVQLLPVTDEDGYLTNEWIESRNCIDQGETVTIMGFELLLCSEVQTVLPDENGDYLLEPAFGDDEDGFAEVHMYHHANEANRFMQELGLESVNDVPLVTIVNFRIPDFQGGGMTLSPVDNAAFLPAGSFGGGGGGFDRDYDSLLFGQGTSVDFAYDADVIYHEFGHAVVGATADLQQFTFDEQGLSAAPGALNEGYSDYFSSALTGDGQVGDYVGPSFEGGSGSSIRDLDNNLACPQLLWGQVHQDSQHFSGAVWEARAAYVADGGDAQDFDRAVYDAMISLSQTASFDDAAFATIDVLSDLGSDAGNAMDAIFATRAVAECERVIELDSLLFHGVHIIYGGDQFGLNYAPGPLQFAVSVPENTESVTLDYLFQGGGGGFFGGAMEHGWLVSDRPITFSYSGNTVDGDHLFELPAQVNGQNASVTYTEDFSSGEVYFIAIGYTGQQGVIQQLSANIEVGDGPVDPGDDTGTPGDDVGGDDDTGENADTGVDAIGDDTSGGNSQDEGDDVEPDGCGCTTSPTPATGAAWLAIIGLGLVLRPRR